MDMTYTIWSNARRYEFIIRRGDDIVERSGLIYSSKSRANTAMKKAFDRLMEASA